MSRSMVFIFSLLISSQAFAVASNTVAGCLTGLNGRSVGKASAKDFAFALLPTSKVIYVADGKDFLVCNLRDKQKGYAISDRKRNAIARVLKTTKNTGMDTATGKLGFIQFKGRPTTDANILSWNPMDDSSVGNSIEYYDGQLPIHEFTKAKPNFGKAAKTIGALKPLTCSKAKGKTAEKMFIDEIETRVRSAWDLYTDWVMEDKVLKDKNATVAKLRSYFEKGLQECMSIQENKISERVSKTIKKMKRFR